MIRRKRLNLISLARLELKDLAVLVKALVAALKVVSVVLTIFSVHSLVAVVLVVHAQLRVKVVICNMK